MKTKTANNTTRGSAAAPGLTQKDLDGAIAKVDRKSIAKIIKAAHASETDIDNKAHLLELVVTDPNIDSGMLFELIFFLIAFALKFDKLSATQRHALATDPRVIRAVFPHIALAFPKESEDAFAILLKSLVEDHPKLWQSVYARAGEDKE